MFGFAFEFWLYFGLVLVFAEFIMPGLVSVFVGLGALTVAGFLHFEIIESVPVQLITWFISSTIYIFSIRILVMRFYPTDEVKQDIDEDNAMIGKHVEVIHPISALKTGRVRYGESTWTAFYEGEGEIPSGSKVKIIGRNNISWIVSKLPEEMESESC